MENSEELSREELLEYNKKQLKEMNDYKWIESEKAGKDLGQECTSNWVDKFAKKFHDENFPKK
jgi:hypothetical protein